MTTMPTTAALRFAMRWIPRRVTVRASSLGAFLAVLLGLSIPARAAEERIVSGLSGDIGAPVAVGATIEVEDQTYAYMLAHPASGANPWTNAYELTSAAVRVRLFYDDSRRRYTTKRWTLTVTYDITTFDADGTTTDTAGRALMIDYDPTADYTDIAVDEFMHAHRGELTVKGVAFQEYPPNTTPPSPVSVLPDDLPDIHLDLEQVSVRFRRALPAAPTVWQLLVADDHLPISWTYTPGAERYDVEWVFVDVGAAGLTANLPFDFRDAMRVTVSANHVRIPLGYPQGIVLFRVRGVGTSEVEAWRRPEGPWSWAQDFGTTGPLAGSPLRFDWAGLSPAVNWQHTIAFAEDGKNKQVLTFADGTLRARQVATVLNSGQTAVVAETKYDFRGRPAVQVMPTPVPGTALAYRPNFNPNFDPSSFDVNGKVTSPDRLSATSGAGRYFSPDNDDPTGIRAYIPDADGYAYQRTRWMPDGTGRVRAQGGFGPDHQLGSGHETRYVYGTPTSQVELDRLFGTDVGYVARYRKEVVVDANGQASVSYYDDHARVIATALSGEPPPNLLPVDRKPLPVPIDGDVLGNNALTAANELVSTTTIMVSEPGAVYSFHYRITPAMQWTLGCVPGDCRYDLRIEVRDEDGAPIPLVEPGNPPSQAIVVLDQATIDRPFTVTFPDIGAYSLTKIVKVSAQALQDYEERFLDPVNVERCVPKPLVQPASCTTDCAQICEEKYAYTDAAGIRHFLGENGEIVADTQQAHDARVAACVDAAHCNEPLPLPDRCETLRSVMLADMSPGGQYFDNVPHRWQRDAQGEFVRDAAGDLVPNPAYESTWSGVNTYHSGEINDWLNANVKDDSSGTEPWFPTTFGQYTDPDTGLQRDITDWEAVRGHWDPAWAGEKLFDRHPERCAYAYFCKSSCEVDDDGDGTVDASQPISKSNDFDAKMLGGDTDAFAQSNQYFNPLGLATSSTTSQCADQQPYQPYPGSLIDPYFTCIYPPWTTADDVRSEMEGYLRKYLRLDNGTTPGYGSIWYVIDDPNQIGAGTNTCSAYDPAATSVLAALHAPGTGLLQPLPQGGGASRYQFFRSAYQVYKQFIIYEGFGPWAADRLAEEPTSERPWSCAGYRPQSDGVPHLHCPDGPDPNASTDPTNALGFTLRWPCNDLYDHFDPPDYTGLQNFLHQQNANACGTTCEAYAAQWRDEFDGADPNSAADDCLPNNTAQLDALLAHLVAICTASCDAGTAPAGADSCTGKPNCPTPDTFAAAIAQYNATPPGGTCPTLVHPETYDQGLCDCDNLETFVVGHGVAPANWCAPTGVELKSIVAALDDAFEGSHAAADVTHWLQSCDAGCNGAYPPAHGDLEDFPPELSCPATEEIPQGPSDPAGDAAAACAASAQALAQSNADLEWQQKVKAKLASELSAFEKHCLDTLDGRESFTVHYALNEYLYTLYYYDQAGNLVKTVPPEGVVFLTGQTLADVPAHRDNPSSSAIQPSHRMATRYRHNSLEKPIRQSTPDGGVTTFWYDRVGRVAVSQNAKQAGYGPPGPGPGYSFTEYDALGRTIAVGQIRNGTSMTTALARGDDPNTSLPQWIAQGTKEEVVRSFYDESLPASNIPQQFAGGQKYLRNRVASATFEWTDDGNDLTYDNAQHYSYDIHGNVQEFVREIAALAAFNRRFQRVTYDYDVVSGNVNGMSFEGGGIGQFHHRFLYDADNRVTHAFSSKDGRIWEKDAKYFYYPHGPLARAEIGDRQVQGQDYAYTIHGWIKGINAGTLVPRRDMGKDGLAALVEPNSVFAADAFGVTLGYYDDGTNADYVPIGAAMTAAEYFEPDAFPPNTQSEFAQDFAPLYNGNISHMVTALQRPPSSPAQPPLAVQGTGYRYDQLNRLMRMRAHSGAAGTFPTVEQSNVWPVSSGDKTSYAEDYEYDFNGNIESLRRNGLSSVAGGAMDDLTYQYKWVNPGAATNPALRGDGKYDNRLLHVGDTVAANLYPQNPSDPDDVADIDDQGGSCNTATGAGCNYVYDALGSLEHDAQELAGPAGKIEWTAAGKIRRVIRDANANATNQPDLEFEYDPTGYRLAKIVKPRNTNGTLESPDKWVRTFYLRDPRGEILAIEEQAESHAPGPPPGTQELRLIEHHIYGSKRVGIANPDVLLAYQAPYQEPRPVPPYVRTLGKKSYEGTNHLASVLVTVLDRAGTVPVTQTEDREDFERPSPSRYRPVPSTDLPAVNGLYVSRLRTAPGDADYSPALRVEVHVGDVITATASGYYTALDTAGKTGGLVLKLVDEFNQNVKVGLLDQSFSDELSNFPVTPSNPPPSNPPPWNALSVSYTVPPAALTAVAGGRLFAITYAWNPGSQYAWFDALLMSTRPASAVAERVGVPRQTILYYPFGSRMPMVSNAVCGTCRYAHGFDGLFGNRGVHETTDVYSAEYREYDAGIGRWMSADPRESPTGLAYAAFDNNPMALVDPDGLQAVDQTGDATDDSGTGTQAKEEPKETETSALKEVTVVEYSTETMARIRKELGPIEQWEEKDAKTTEWGGRWYKVGKHWIVEVPNGMNPDLIQYYVYHDDRLQSFDPMTQAQIDKERTEGVCRALDVAQWRLLQGTLVGVLLVPGEELQAGRVAVRKWLGRTFLGKYVAEKIDKRIDEAVELLDSDEPPSSWTKGRPWWPAKPKEPAKKNE